jgi:hypothetical protein
MLQVEFSNFHFYVARIQTPVSICYDLKISRPATECVICVVSGGVV